LNYGKCHGLTQVQLPLLSIVFFYGFGDCHAPPLPEGLFVLLWGFGRSEKESGGDVAESCGFYEFEQCVDKSILHLRRQIQKRLPALTGKHGNQTHGSSKLALDPIPCAEGIARILLMGAH
jgi:hypothetical protein